MIPVNERRVRRLRREWVVHDNRGRPHTSLGPGIPDPPHNGLASCCSGHQIRDGHRVVAAPVLGGLVQCRALVRKIIAKLFLADGKQCGRAADVHDTIRQRRRGHQCLAHRVRREVFERGTRLDDKHLAIFIRQEDLAVRGDR